jgi:phospholipid/cholesterol/gamma-HCH transport system permease protein
VKRVLAALGAPVVEAASTLGGILTLGGRILRSVRRADSRELWRAFYRMGVQSLPIIIMTALFTGAIMVIQAALYMKRFTGIGTQGLLGWGACYIVFREIGPVLIGLMFNGRVGANNTAELGTMAVTEQIDALRALAIDPIGYLVVPRIIAMVLCLFFLVIYGDICAIFGGMMVGWALLGVTPASFINSILQYITLEDFTMGLWKAVTFGLTIALVSSYFGTTTGGGAVGVGRSVNASVVASALGLMILNFVVTSILL